MVRYQPPKQSKIGQVFDVIVLLVLTMGALYLPLYMGLAGRAASPSPQDNPTWESLGQNATMVERWTALGYADPASAQDIITSRFDYSFSAISLIVMIVVVKLTAPMIVPKPESARPSTQRCPPMPGEKALVLSGV